MSKLDAARKLTAKGFRVFPLAINGKVPALDGNWQKLATQDPARIAELWSCPVFGDPVDYNIGIALSADTLVVDVDVRDGKRGAESLALWEAINDPLPATYEVRTASGGRHLYFATAKSGSFPARLCEGVDLKDHGDYVVGPGSEIDGAFYTEGTGSVVPLSGQAEALAARGVARVRSLTAATLLVDTNSESAIVRAVDWLAHHAPDAGTYKVAARVKDFGISQEKCEQLLMEFWPPAAAKGDEHVAFRVANAYSYGQNAVGIASAEAEFDAVEIDVGAQKARPARRGLYGVRWDDARPQLDRAYLVKNLIHANTMVVTYGDSNVGKSYVVLDLAFCVATGREWNKRKVQRALVAYVAAEGGHGFTGRIEAYRRHYDAHGLPFLLIPCPIDLFSEQAQTGSLIRLIQEAESQHDLKCGLVVVDTLARAMAGGDENTAMDMGRFVANCDRVRVATGAAVNIIHHTGKDASKGARGSSALRAATDTEIEVRAGTMSIAKQRDMAPVPDATFALKSIDIGATPDGDQATACVVDWSASGEFESRLSIEAREFFELLEGLVAEKRDATGDDKADNAVDWGEWELSGLETLKGARGGKISRSVLFRLRKELTQSGLVTASHKNQWVIT